MTPPEFLSHTEPSHSSGIPGKKQPNTGSIVSSHNSHLSVGRGKMRSQSRALHPLPNPCSCCSAQTGFLSGNKRGKIVFSSCFLSKFPRALWNEHSRISREVGKSPGHGARHPLISFPCCSRKRIGNSGINSWVGSWNNPGITSLLSQAVKFSL